MNQQNFTRLGKTMWAEQVAVSSIEYALIGSLIAVVIVGAVGVVGTRTLALFSLIANCVNSAISGSGSCS